MQFSGSSIVWKDGRVPDLSCPRSSLSIVRQESFLLI
jgi:hypothetical protein